MTVRLRNGIPLTLVHQTSAFLAVAVVAAGGVMDVGADKVETVGLMMKTMTVASKTRDSEALANARALLTMPEFESNYYSDGVYISARMPSERNVRDSVKLFADVVLDPALTQDHFDWYARARARILDIAATDATFIGQTTLRKALFGRHPYAEIEGTSADVRAVKRADVVALHARLFDASRLSIVAAGGMNDNELVAAIDAAFGGVSRLQQAPHAPASVTVPSGPRIIVVDRPGATVTRIDAGFVGPAANAGDIDAAEAALQVLASPTFGRVTMKLRGELHAAWVHPHWYRLRASELLGWQSVLPTQQVSEALAEMDRQIKGLAEGGPSADELSILHDGNAASLGAMFGTSAQTVWAYSLASVVGLQPESVMQTTARRMALDASAIRAAASRWLDPTRMRVVLVGDWATMRDAVTALGWGVTVEAGAAVGAGK